MSKLENLNIFSSIDYLTKKNQLFIQVNRLQVQLNLGHSGFTEFRDKKSSEILLLQQEIAKLRQQVIIS
jgi:hypothetical protein